MAVEEAALALQALFRGFASECLPTIAPSRSRKIVALGLSDFVRLAHAAQVRLPRRDLEGVFHSSSELVGGTGSGSSPSSSLRAPTLGFEAFVEALVQTAQLCFVDSSKAEAMSCLLRESLIPLASQMREDFQEASA